MNDFKIPDVPPQAIGVGLAMLISIIRVVMDSQEIALIRILLEAILCGALALSLHYGIVAMGLDRNWSVFAGGLIGYLGSHTVRYIAFNVIHKRLLDNDNATTDKTQKTKGKGMD